MKTTKKLQKNDKQKKEFLKNISHDMRTPLTSMLGYLKMIENKDYKDENEFWKYFNIVNKKANYIKNILDHYFIYSNICLNDFTIEFSIICIQGLLLNLLDGKKDDFKAKNLKLNVNILKKYSYINANKELLSIALNNVMLNVLNYSKEKSAVNIIMKEEIKNSKNYMIIEIYNSPKEKIEKKDAKKFFYELYKGSESRSNDGCGLGLNIAKEIMKIHNGFITISVLNNVIKCTLGILK